ncbi:hypothetical protein CTAM01_04325 [Colletotrichum tamarilloi]|uniref:Secreted protein n=1 Tax=Colletotrichum tamarilloi TaxID=1209934 RepID=A0ABQ9RI41_9PEZI|nr:uncharacterized protein CTAM01_04325 [Colletotrichum tamarilloi]KAK1504095.1 hypothetical protein CTAM01_04325 [Colletotrichum tamarilloi]
MRVTPGLFLACLVILDGYTTYPCVGTRGGWRVCRLAVPQRADCRARASNGPWTLSFCPRRCGTLKLLSVDPSSSHGWLVLHTQYLSPGSMLLERPNSEISRPGTLDALVATRNP